MDLRQLVQDEFVPFIQTVNPASDHLVSLVSQGHSILL
jgi:hypothetical protein